MYFRDPGNVLWDPFGENEPAIEGRAKAGAATLLFVSLAQPGVGHTVVGVAWLLAGGWGLVLLFLSLPAPLDSFTSSCRGFLLYRHSSNREAIPWPCRPSYPCLSTEQLSRY